MLDHNQKFRYMWSNWLTLSLVLWKKPVDDEETLFQHDEKQIPPP